MLQLKDSLPEIFSVGRVNFALLLHGLTCLDGIGSIFGHGQPGPMAQPDLAQKWNMLSGRA
jgi:hypothetical protein